jgi:hypothetical protein
MRAHPDNLTKRLECQVSVDTPALSKAKALRRILRRRLKSPGVSRFRIDSAITAARKEGLL